MLQGHDGGNLWLFGEAAHERELGRHGEGLGRGGRGVHGHVRRARERGVRARLAGRKGEFVATGSTRRQDSGQVVDFHIRISSETGQQIKDPQGPLGSRPVAWTASPWRRCLTRPRGRCSRPSCCRCVLTDDGGECVNVDESGGCIVWRGSERGQSVTHPSGLWCVCALPNGDFATGCQDHVVSA
ncbi:unnamed protein product [Ectocarpus sp. 4 AP-2014]